MTESKPFRRLSKFELHELIGEGAMGVVWKAYDSVLRRYVALKLLGSQFGKTHDARDRFLREARAAGALQHPNILTVYDFGEAESQLFIAMELVEGRDLSDLIAAREPLALERKLDIVIEMLQGLAYAHDRGVIHRDIKPSNVRITTDGRVKIMDFGIARLQSADATDSGAIIGTPSYMAPEQITNGPITPATDVFTVGCLLHELLTYSKPFEGESVQGVLYQVLTTEPKPLRTVAPSIPASLERVVAKALNKVPEDRYTNAKQMQQALSGIRDALSGATDSPTLRLASWTAGPALVVRLLRHAPLKWRLAALTALAGVAVVLLYFSLTTPALDEGATAAAPAPAPARSAPPAAGPRLPPDSAVLANLNPALRARRDSAFAERERALLAGAMKNEVPSVALAETMLEASDRALRAGDQARALSGYVAAVGQYRKARAEADELRREARRAVDRVTPVVRALPTGPDAARAAILLSRAESLYQAADYGFAKLAAQSAEQIGVAAGIAPPSPQPADPRRAVEVLLEDLARAVASERVENMRVLYPGMTTDEARGWRYFFRGAERIQARYTIQQFTMTGGTVEAEVRALLQYAPAGGGAPREDRPRLRMRFTKTANGWRVTAVPKPQ
ncbi:MAG: protein kinase [Gemmatimonadetes bacterium]|nr:protein kinase [Gemmatimonadota bacterium]